MLQINLIPEEARRNEETSLEQFHRTPLMWFIIGCMAVSALGLLCWVQLQNRKLHRLNEEINQLRPQKTVIDQLQGFVQKLQQESSAFEALKPQGASWSERLSTLAALTPNGVWFKELLWDPAEGFRLEGLALQEEGAEMAKISRFMQQLEQHASMKGLLADLKIDSIERAQDETIEMVRFTITAKVNGS